MLPGHKKETFPGSHLSSSSRFDPSLARTAIVITVLSVEKKQFCKDRPANSESGPDAKDSLFLILWKRRSYKQNMPLSRSGPITRRYYWVMCCIFQDRSPLTRFQETWKPRM